MKLILSLCLVAAVAIPVLAILMLLLPQVLAYRRERRRNLKLLDSMKIPVCPYCHIGTERRVGHNTGVNFFGCPQCDFTLPSYRYRIQQDGTYPKASTKECYRCGLPFTIECTYRDPFGEIIPPHECVKKATPQPAIP